MTRFVLASLIALSAPLTLAACGDDDEVEVDVCSDDIDCDDGFICEITDEDDGICIEE